MSEPTDSPRREISLLAIWHFLWRHIAVIGTCSVAFGVSAAVLAFTLMPMYRSEVVFSLASSSATLAESAGQLGELAAVAGINIDKKSEEAVQYLRSRGFTSQFIQRHA